MQFVLAALLGVKPCKKSGFHKERAPTAKRCDAAGGPQVTVVETRGRAQLDFASHLLCAMALEGVLDDYTWLEMDPDEIVRRYMQEDVGAVQLSDVAAIQLSKETLILRLSQFVDFSAAKLDEVTGRCPCS